MQIKDISITFQGRSYVGFDFQGLPLEVAVAVGQQQVDKAADAARILVLGECSRAVEYDIAASEAQAFTAAGYEGDAPGSVEALVVASGVTAQEAADSILTAATAFRDAINGVRAIRLKAKRDIALAINHDGVEFITDTAAAQITARIAGVGNAAQDL
ncbi:hypothetical protein ASF84_01515 [Pseudomonas sp. Leaf127]|uniref:hypothetical protein n=1 Tax=Pseudomonas sp. Leaf127 TaxID=1736267 RepID=UPI000703C260|nr:hypothetical protein [Pseudomonas sp. Leaf127]KQQ67843.1 hypothetical protein ASF84_01515 [Pseudomonas sp. Leaf127]